MAIDPASRTDGAPDMSPAPNGAGAASRTRTRTATSFLVIGLILAMAGFGLTFYLGTQLAASTPTVVVLVAAHDIAAGTPLVAADLTSKKYLAASAPASALHTVDDAVGRAARVDIVAGDPILSSMVGPLSAGIAPVSLLPVPPGYVAVQIVTPPGLSIPGGFIAAGSFVDVIVTANLSLFKPGAAGAASRVVFHEVEVIRVGNGTAQSAQSAQSGITVVTVLLDECDLPYAAWFGANTSVYVAALPLQQGQLPVPDTTCPGLVTDRGVGPAEINSRYHFTS